MKKHIILILSLFYSKFCFCQTPLPIKDKREIFVDDYLIARSRNISQVLHDPKNEGIVLKFDKPWEGNFSAYCTVIKDEDKYRMYYRGVREAKGDGAENEVTCYAESEDGINWVKPELSLFPQQGFKKTNIVLAKAAPVTHNFSPFLDTNPSVKKEEKYKAIGGTDKSGLIAYVSADGINWKMLQSGPVFTKGVFDSQNVAFWSESEQMYVCYFRTWSKGGFKEYKGYRSVSRTTSKDFVHWTEPEYMSFGDSPMDHLYTHQTSPYFRSPHIYLAIGARFMPNRQVVSDEEAKILNVDPKYYKDCSDVVLLSTRGGTDYDRKFMESYIRPGIGLRNWVSRSNYPVLNIVQTGENEMSLYVNEDYAQPTSHIKRYSLRLDGFASLKADYYGGEVLTKLLTFEGKELELNYSTSSAGSIKVELQDPEGKAIPGFSLADCEEIIGNETRRVVKWKGNRDLYSLEGESIRMRIVMRDADLYSIKFNK